VTTPQKWLAGVGALVAAALVGAGVGLLTGGSGKTEISTSATTTSTSPTTTTTTLAATTSTTAPTTVTVGIICTTPADATQSVVNAWIAGDRAAASRCASNTVVTKLFQASGAGAKWTFQGCHGDPGVPTCSYSYQGGGANFTLNGSEASGWKLVSLTFVAG
jgi:hypothetical protein